MPEISVQEKTKGKTLAMAVVRAGLLVGTLDITAAVIQTLLNGREPVAMLQFIASGFFGNEAFSGGLPAALYGLVFHYCIAMGWTLFFFLVVPGRRYLSKNRVATGAGYGLFVWVIMSRVVLPLSNTPSLPFHPLSAIIAIMILIVCIGLPLSFLARKYFSGNQRQA